MGWEKQLVSPEQVIHMMRPGMRVFVGTGVAEPRTLVKHLLASHCNKLVDLELIQLASFAEGDRRRPCGFDPQPSFPDPPIDGNR
ncbi:MAG: hypothetical protein P8X96_14865 [Desulfobacteraceae bacterium]